MRTTPVIHTRFLVAAAWIGLLIALIGSVAFNTSAQADQPLATCGADVARQLVGHSTDPFGEVFRTAWSPRGKLFVTIGFNEMYLWDVESNLPVRRFEGLYGETVDVQWSPDGRYLLTTNLYGNATLWDVSRSKPLRDYSGMSGSAHYAAWSPDSQFYVIAGERDVTLWAVQRPHPIRRLDRDEIATTADTVAWSANGKWFVTTGHDDQTFLWDKGRIAPVRQYTGQFGAVYTLAWNPDGDQFLTADDGVDIRLWDTQHDKAVKQYTTADNSLLAITVIAWNPDGQRFVTGGESNSLYLWDKDQSAPILQYTGLRDDGHVLTVNWNPDGTRFLTASAGEITLWQVDNPQPIWAFKMAIGGVNNAGWSPDGKWIAVVGNIGQVFLWDVGKLEGLLKSSTACLPISAYTPTPTPDSATITAVAQSTQQAMATFFTENTATRAADLLTATVVTFTPTPTASAQRAAQIGEQHSTIPLTGGEVWTYAGKAGEVLTIRVNADKPANDTDEATRAEQGLLDTYFILHGPDGSVLAEVDDINPGIVTNSLLENFSLPSSGTYSIEVRGWNNSTGGGYTLVLESSRSTTATPITPTDEIALTLTYQSVEQTGTALYGWTGLGVRATETPLPPTATPTMTPT
jgi:WD40 repeat protein